MADTSSTFGPRLGKTVTSIPDGALGSQKVKSTRSGTNESHVTLEHPLECRLALNDSGVTLNPKEAVAWKSNYIGTRVGEKVNTTYQKAAGIVDPWVASVADGEYFNLIVRGLIPVEKPVTGAAANIAAGAICVAHTANGTTASDAGQVEARVIAGSTDSTDSLVVNYVEGNLGTAQTAAATTAEEVYLIVDTTRNCGS